jgi:signal transduction histidine kinase/CheY-like chemotaxis protein
LFPDRGWRLDGGRRSLLQPKPIIIGLGVLIILLICVGGGVATRELRLRDVNDEKRELTALDLLLAEETERTLQSVDLVLKSLQQDLVLDGVTKPQEFIRSQSDASTYALLKSRIVGIPQLASVSMIGFDGSLINSSNQYPVPRNNVANADYFISLEDAPSSGPYLSQPVRDNNGNWTIYLARRVNGPSGKFLGLVVAAVDLGYFENFYRTLEIGGGAVSLWRSDGTLLARYPSVPGVGHVFKIPAFSGILHGDEPATYEVAKAIDGQARIVATIRVKNFPLVVNITKAVEQVLADWHQVATLIIVGALLCIVALGFVLWLLLRQLNAYEALAIADKERNEAVAEREQAEAQLRQAQKLESIGQLTGGIAHDFNNLLTAVLGNLELLKKYTQDGDERLNRWASNAFDAANRGAVLTQRLLVFSRRQPLEPRPADLVAMLASMSDLLRRTLGENIEIETHVAPGLWQAFADLNQLDNAILNIAINARDAMEGHGRLTIAASNCQVDEEREPGELDVAPGQYVLLSISDTGEGIEKDVLDRVFEPFFSTKPAGQGTGLGLSQVYGFVKQTGGHVKIDSVPGEGTTVKLYLPRAHAEESGAALESDSEEKSGGQTQGTVLVVEDDPDVRAYSAEILRDLGYRVREAGNAKTALETLRESSDFALLFSDVGLPGMNGTELAEEALRLRPQLRILLTTGYAQDQLIDRCGFERGILLLTKPFTRAELAEKIKQLLTPRQIVSGEALS